MLAVAVGGTAGLVLAGRTVLTESVRSFVHMDWAWLPLAVVAESGSMAAFARIQRRLLRAGGTTLHLGSVMAVTYAGNAISVSLPLAGSEVATAFTFRQYKGRGIEPAAAAWALAVSGIVSSFAFALVLGGGAIASGNPTAASLGLALAAVSLMPTVGILAALRYPSLRRLLNRLLARMVNTSRRLVSRPGAGAEDALERFLERIAALRLPPLQYAEVVALAVWNWVADCFCLAAAIRATGTHVPWQGLFLAYGLSMTAGSFGLTPGGLGVIEVTLAAALAAAGIAGHHALAAVLVYRLISFWAVMAAGWAVLALLTRRQQPATAEVSAS
jgi:uncharacterized protein (TIRG00374 family)